MNRYKQPVVLGKKLEDMARNPYPGHFTQWIADNVAHNLITLDGKNSFHGTGIISVSTPSGGDTLKQDTKVTMLKQLTPGDITSNRGVSIQRYTPPLKAALMNIKMRPLYSTSVSIYTARNYST